MSSEARFDIHCVRRCLEEFTRLGTKTTIEESALAETALFVEEPLGITLSDDEICAENLESPDSVIGFALKKLKSWGMPCAESAES